MQYAPYVERLTLIPSSGGRFEVSVGDELVFSKKSLGRHANPDEIAGILEERFGFVKTPAE